MERKEFQAIKLKKFILLRLRHTDGAASKLD
jgi:hypothetical protein